jgi:uncharacterized protein YbcV (DUF1398 family)
MLSSTPTQLVADALARGMRVRPRVGGFPSLAEALRQAGIHLVHCDVASRATSYHVATSVVIDLQTPLAKGLTEVAAFDRDALVAAIGRDQRGESTYDEFVGAIWQAGVVTYDVDLAERTCTYVGADPTLDAYVERYAAAILAD